MYYTVFQGIYNQQLEVSMYMEISEISYPVQPYQYNLFIIKKMFVLTKIYGKRCMYLYVYNSI